MTTGGIYEQCDGGQCTVDPIVNGGGTGGGAGDDGTGGKTGENTQSVEDLMVDGDATTSPVGRQDPGALEDASTTGTSGGTGGDVGGFGGMSGTTILLLLLGAYFFLT